jgi:hypothetical protein
MLIDDVPHHVEPFLVRHGPRKQLMRVLEVQVNGNRRLAASRAR